MKPRVFLDTNIFIYGFEFPDSNSAEIIKLLNQAETGGDVQNLTASILQCRQEHTAGRRNGELEQADQRKGFRTANSRENPGNQVPGLLR